jgi:hypothetical protein
VDHRVVQFAPTHRAPAINAVKDFQSEKRVFFERGPTALMR